MNKKWKGPGLRTRIFIILTALILITLTGGSVMMWYTVRMEALFTDVINMDLAALRAAEELQTALVNQKGFVTYYYLDGNPEWLKKLEEYHQIFKGWFAEALKSARTEKSKAILKEIGSEYNTYINAKRKVISLYQAGELEKGSKLHNEVRGKFFKILELCEKYKDIHNKGIELIRQKSRRQAERLRIIAGTAMTTALSLGVLLAFILVIQILNPIRRLAQYVDTTGVAAESRNEVTTLKRRVRGLIEDFDLTHTELERSRERLLLSEKMAMIGKLAAEVAHSIRNPMTSIKMRLFSLERNLNLTLSQKEDFEVISKEMRSLDNIVRNFLEFARPPKLKMQSINISEIVDMTLQLLRSRFELHGIKVERHRSKYLPEIEADPELLKEALVNLVINACEAMRYGGRLTVTEEDSVAERIGRAVLIQIKDSGPGIPESIRDKIMEPFFSTKEDGTGLGLSIAKRIIEEHGGQLALRSGADEGANFIITLPVREDEQA